MKLGALVSTLFCAAATSVMSPVWAQQSADELMVQAKLAARSGNSALEQFAVEREIGAAVAVEEFRRSLALLRRIVSDHADSEVALDLATSRDFPALTLEGAESALSNAEALEELPRCLEDPTPECLAAAAILAARSAPAFYGGIGKGYSGSGDRGAQVITLIEVASILRQSPELWAADEAIDLALELSERIVTDEDRKIFRYGTEMAALLGHTGQIDRSLALISENPDKPWAIAFAQAVVSALVDDGRLDEALSLSEQVREIRHGELLSALAAEGRWDDVERLRSISSVLLTEAQYYVARTARDGMQAVLEEALQAASTYNRVSLLSLMLRQFTKAGEIGLAAETAERYLAEIDDGRPIGSNLAPDVVLALALVGRTDEARGLLGKSSGSTFAPARIAIVLAYARGGKFPEAWEVAGSINAGWPRGEALLVLAGLMISSGADYPTPATIPSFKDPVLHLAGMTAIAAVAAGPRPEWAASARDDAVKLALSLNAKDSDPWAVRELARQLVMMGQAELASKLLTRHGPRPDEAWFSISLSLVESGECSAALDVSGQMEQPDRARLQAKLASRMLFGCRSQAEIAYLEALKGVPGLLIPQLRASALADLAIASSELR